MTSPQPQATRRGVSATSSSLDASYTGHPNRRRSDAHLVDSSTRPARPTPTPTLSALPRAPDMATRDRLAYAFPGVCEYLEAVECDLDRQRQRYEAKAAELLRSINIGQELMEQLDSVRLHCTAVARERDTLQLRVGQLQREGELLARTPAPAPVRSTAEDTSEALRRQQRAEYKELQGTKKALEAQLEAMRKTADTLAGEKLLLEKAVFERDVRLESLTEKLSECQGKLRQATRRGEQVSATAAKEAERHRQEATLAQFLSVSDVRAVTVLMDQLRSRLEAVVKTGAAAVAGRGAEVVPGGALTRGSASARFMLRVGTPTPSSDSDVHAVYRPPPALPTIAPGAGRGSASPGDAESSTSQGEERDEGWWATAPPQPGGLMLAAPLRALPQRHEALQRMLDTMQAASDAGAVVEGQLQRLALALDQHRQQLSQREAELASAGEQAKALQRARDECERQRVAAAEETGRAVKQAAAEQAHLSAALADAEQRARERLQAAHRELNTVRQQAAADRAALEREAALECDRLQAAHDRVERELAERTASAEAAARRHAEVQAALSEQLRDGEAARATLAEERAAALAEVERHGESLERLRRAAETRLRECEAAAAAELQERTAEWRTAVDAVRRERDGLQSQLDALHRRSQQELDAMQAAKLAAVREAEEAREALAAVETDVLPAQRARVEQLGDRVEELTRELTVRAAALEAREREQDAAQTARAALEKRLAAALDTQRDLQSQVDVARQEGGEGRRALEEAHAATAAAEATAATLRREVEELRGSLGALRSQTAMLQRHVSDHGRAESQAAEVLRLKLAESQQLLTETAKERDTLQQRLDAAEEQAVGLQRALQASQQTATTATDRAKRLEAEVLQREGEALQRVAHMESAHGRLQAEAAALKRQWAAGEEQRAALQAALAKTEERAAALGKDLAAARAQAQEEQRRQLVRVREACDAVSREHAAALAAAERDRADAREAADRAAATLATREAALLALQQDTEADALTRHARHRETIAALEEEVRQLRGEVAELAEGKAAAEQQARLLAAAPAAGIEEREASVSALRGELDECHREREALRTALSTSAEHLRTVQAEAAEGARQVRAAAAAEVAEWVQSARELRAAREADRQRHAGEVQSLREALSAAQAAAARHRTAAEALAAAESERDRLAVRLQRLEADGEAAVERHRGALAAVEADRSRLQSALTALRGEVRAVRDGLPEKERALVVRAHEEAAEREARQGRQHAAALAARDEELDTLRAQLRAREEASAAMGVELRERTEQLREANQARRLLEESLEVQRRELQALRVVNVRLEARLEGVEGDRDPLRQQLHSLLSAE